MLPQASNTRLITIVAQVDHGKTTLADSLISSNGIISDHLAGTIRYLDNLEEEQRRGITMKASAIGLRHSYNVPKYARTKNENSNGDDNSKMEMVIHLIDSPGHIDFSAEVSSSLLLCDGALLVVDVVEGMCARTQMILREAYANELVPILILNKIDRLCLDLCLTPTDAYIRLRELIERINAATAGMIISRNSEQNENFSEQTEEAAQNDSNIENIWNFDPTKGNVVFASAYYGWGFTISSLAKSLFKTEKIKVKPPVLKQYLFGDFKFHEDTNKVTKWNQAHYYNQNDQSEPMFAQYVLKPLWDIYEGIDNAASEVGITSGLFADGRSSTNNGSKQQKKITTDLQSMNQVLEALQYGGTYQTILSQAKTEDSPEFSKSYLQSLIQHHSTTESMLRAILRQYRPISDAILDAACEHCPSPEQAASSIRKQTLALQNSSHENFSRIQGAVLKCTSSLGNDVTVPTVAHVCKFIVTSRSSINDPSFNEEDAVNSDNSAIIMGLARVLCGTLHSNQVEYYMHGPKHKETNVAVKRPIRLYLLMGSSFIPIDRVPAGHICAVYGLEDLQLKTITMCDEEGGMPLSGFHGRRLQPLVKVNVEPELASHKNALEKGLMRLSLADSSVEVTTTSRGECLLACLGEIHLENAIKELESIYCCDAENEKQIKLRISDPIVEFCESCTWFDNEIDYGNFTQTMVRDEKKYKPLRQVTIPPYRDEEGLNTAWRGRSRAMLSGRSAAITIRVLPLPKSVFGCLAQKKVMKGTENDLIEIGEALGMVNFDKSSKNNNVDNKTEISAFVLDHLITSLCCLDSNNNAMIESPGVFNGFNVKGVASPEVYTPSFQTCRSQNENDHDDNEPNGNIESIERQQNENKKKEKFELVQRYIMNLERSCWTREKQSLQDVVCEDSSAVNLWKKTMRGSAEAGFKLAVGAGPLCEEPLYGVLVVLEGVEIAMKQSPPDGSAENKYTNSNISGGMVVYALRSGIRCAFLSRPVRLVEGHLRLTLHSSLGGLGPLYAILSKRRGRVISDCMVNGTDLILITATIPQAESFRLSSELLEKSSGEVTAPELLFSHWSILDEDPFWIPTSKEEREDYGEILTHGDCSTGIDSNSLRYIRMTRKRKGLLVDSSKVVGAAEKQRTLARKK